MSKVNGELMGKTVGTARNGSPYTDVTIGTAKYKLWDTIKRGGAVITNPAKTSLDGCRIGDMVEAEIATSQGGYTSISDIALQSRPNQTQAEPAPGQVVQPVGQSGHSWESFQMTHGPAVIQGLLAGLSGKDVDIEGNPTGKVRDFSWLEEGNHERVAAMYGGLMDSLWLNFEGRRAYLENAVE